MKLYKANFTNDKRSISTGWYKASYDCQRALERKIGRFPHLGTVAGDPNIIDKGHVLGNRLGGLVTITERNH